MRTLTIRDAIQGADIVTHVLGDAGPLVVVSHGTGGTPLAYRGLADHLAAHGFTLALVEHPGNKRGDDALASSIENLIHRPRHIKHVLDALGADAAAVVGHSLGGYTALAIAGGNPVALPGQTPSGAAEPLTVEHDARIRAVVLLAPAVPWFMAPGALDAVEGPVLALLGEHDDVTPPYFTEPILRRLRHVELRVIPGAGHFAFLWPIAPHLVAAKLPPSLDPPGFDRAAFQPALYDAVTRFLRASC